ncbi:MAG: helicase C-terminal domain-containing protein [Nocardioidaceae bacterium]|nr:helicase C-terminal domain-containing protein [Nocardioidaceae bacterium]
MPSTAAPRTLADQLRSWPDERLAALLRARPDLASPAPHDSGQLAARAAVRASLLRAMDGLTRLELTVLEALAALGPAGSDELRAWVHADPAATDAALDRLLGLVLAWESPQGLRTLTGVLEGLTGSAASTGLHPRSPSPAAAEEVARRLASVSPAALALLDHLDANGGEGTTSATSPADGAAPTPVQELLAARLVLPRASGFVVLPGEVAVAVRGGRTTREPADAVPELATTSRDATLVARAAAGAAFELVRRVELLLEHWGTRPPLALRSGGLGVRDLKAAAQLLHVDEAAAALVVEVAAAAQLVTTGSAAGDPAWLPTDAFDQWAVEPPAVRWVRLVRAWLDSSRLAALVGSKDRSGAKSWNALAPEMSSVFAVESRRMALASLASLPPGEVLAAGTGLPSLVARVAWQRPRRPASRAQLVAWAIAEAAALGVTGLDALAAPGRLLLEGDDEAAAAALEPDLPEEVDHVLIQADLTAVAPGPLVPDRARTLHLLADIESRGGATVYRFTGTSVRRAFDAGWSAGEVHDFLTTVSRTPVPQPLTYLVDDVSRTFGTLRVGHAEAFLRTDDEAALAELLHHPQAGTLGLRRIAPTVLVSTVPIDELVARLREIGSAPVVEAADGTVHLARPDRHRTRTPRDRRPLGLSAAREAATVTAVVTALRAGDRAAASRPRSAGTTSPADSLTALRDAVEARATVTIGYVDHHGTSTERVVDPLAVEGGQLTAYDHRSDDRRSFALHRITTVRALPQAVDPG